jgi:hypothetical protein
MNDNELAEWKALCREMDTVEPNSPRETAIVDRLEVLEALEAPEAMDELIEANP